MYKVRVCSQGAGEKMVLNLIPGVSNAAPVDLETSRAFPLLYLRVQLRVRPLSSRGSSTEWG